MKPLSLLYPPENEHVWEWITFSASCPSLSPVMFEKTLSIRWEHNGEGGMFSLFHTVVKDEYLCGILFGDSAFAGPLLKELDVRPLETQRFAICVTNDQPIYYETALLPNEYLLVSIWSCDFSCDTNPESNSFVVHLSNPQKVSLCIFNTLSMNCSYCKKSRPCFCSKADLNVIRYSQRNQKLRACEVIETYTKMRGSQLRETGMSLYEITYIAPQISLKTFKSADSVRSPYTKSFQFLTDPCSIGEGLAPIFQLQSPRRARIFSLKDSDYPSNQARASGSDSSSGSRDFSHANSPMMGVEYEDDLYLGTSPVSAKTECLTRGLKGAVLLRHKAEDSPGSYMKDSDNNPNLHPEGHEHGQVGPAVAKARPFFCKYCRKSFGRKSHLTEHEAAVHERSLRNECNLCGVKCSTKRALARHKRRIHEEEKRFACTLCDSSFYQKSDLKRHNELKHGRTEDMSQPSQSQTNLAVKQGG
eukprot:Plantae.Rhodophyta-Purpureofilum_apyrenoidigerum.ctg17468.p1 GENE.Plantae.Rhodophyta-Purpureofilum_apyrenoidigerum.ctg17468~~Plantae.Rhodophyta-Purpureofilum_apyrenoidigerum.ctg17468.p1  ORF type:complete len:474 (-),score=46.06 Plantae.Rhodophyta-Purpureofilum_apyrenoidigerum.ctg17468:457-1878(-)